MPKYDCIVVGAGISGLTAAYTLHKRGASVLLVEANERVGGALYSETTSDGFTLEHGTQTVSSDDPDLWDHFAELGIDSERITTNSQMIHLPYQGELKPLSLSPFALLRSNLLSFSAKLRLCGEPFLPRARTNDESIAHFFNRRFGTEFTRTIVEPFVSGVYGGDLTELSVKAMFPSLWKMEQSYGSLFRGLLARSFHKSQYTQHRRETFSFYTGLSSWTQALANALDDSHVWLNTSATKLQPTERSWNVTVVRDGREEVVNAKRVLLAVPAEEAAKLVAELEPMAAHALQTMPTPPLAVVHLGYRREDVAHPLDGMGMLCPSHEACQTLGHLWMSMSFPGRAPYNHVLITTFVGGARTSDLAMQDEASLIGMVGLEHRRYLGTKSEPVFAQVRSWHRSIPQYDAAHHHRLGAYNRLEARWSGLYLIGNYRNGFSVEKCWQHARNVAASVVLYA